MKSFIWSTVVAALVVGGCSREPEQAAEEQISDQELQEIVKARLQSDANVARLNLSVTADVEHQAVQLEGVAYTQLQRTRAVQLAGGVRPGIAVSDKIEVKPYEIPRDLFDDEMMQAERSEASKAGDELGDTLDDGWLHMKVVSKLIADTSATERRINVDVSDSVVTLRGSVPTQEARAEAESVAESVEGVTSVRNRLVVVRPPAER